ncbi:ANTAR domain-containing protein [Rhodococcus erythropolis]
MTSRARIEQAKGVLMVARALGILLEQSQQRNIRLAVIANELMAPLPDPQR